MFPKRGELGPIERFTLSIGLSIAITVFDGFALNYTRWGFRPNSIVISLSLIMGIFLILAIFQRLRLKESGYSFSFNDIVTFYHTIRNEKPENGPEYDPALEKMLIKTMIVCILIVSAMLVYAKVTTEPEKFTALYILGENGKAENYPEELRLNETSHLLVGIENYEYETVNYKLVLKFGDSVLKEEDIKLDHKSKWLNNVTFEPLLSQSTAFAESTPKKLEIQLLKDNKTYRSVHLLMTVNPDAIRFSDVPQMINGDMEERKGWIFSSSSPNITGSYDKPTNSTSNVYSIKFIGESESSNGTISQDLSTNGNARAVLSFKMQDFEQNISYNIYKQALLDGKVIWESMVGEKNQSLERVELPILLSGNSTLSFRIYGKSAGGNATVFLDDIELRPYGGMSRVKPIIKEYEFNFNVRGEPIPLQKHIKIDGYKFQGFKYDLNENRSYEDLDLVLSENNIIEKGNATYASRISDGTLNVMGIPYTILYKNITSENFSINISRSDIPLEKSLSIDETWSIGDYSLSIKLISSKFDTAILELKQGSKIVLSQTVIIGSNFEYSTIVGNNLTKIFRSKIKSIEGDNVFLTDILLYSNFIELKPGVTIGDFEISNASSEKIIFKNSYPIELKDNAIMLDGNLGFKLSGGELYPYSKGVARRGTPGLISRGLWMNITGTNFPGFYSDNGKSYEDLKMFFSGNGMVNTGEAVYESKVHSGKLNFLGNTYELRYPGRPGYISNITKDQKLKILNNETLTFNGYNFSYKQVDNYRIQLIIRRSMTKNMTELNKRAIKSNITIPLDPSYEMYAINNGTFIKSNSLNLHDYYDYVEEVKWDRMEKKIGGELINIGNNSIELSAKFYEDPFQIYMGKTYGDFDVYSMDSNSITLRNNKPLIFGKGNETSILKNTLKIKTSSNEYLAYPVK